MDGKYNKQVTCHRVDTDLDKRSRKKGVDR